MLFTALKVNIKVMKRIIPQKNLSPLTIKLNKNQMREAILNVLAKIKDQLIRLN